ncbi:hypothetical protein [Paractinoplanes rishiriensis]|uniref:Uncharacterized protein n=1 Tax=Paractinoplanes rishiriensis TaxID=1050105 RepID=A0A919K672_9ACTN|nr:hypothetical protein [Actinoplanes rishiriensis]GIE99288.1 hypothetical protein Ari01nite_67530 [Actinoplanes rishiriensis]
MPHDWRDSLRLAADLALLGMLVTVLSLPLLTAGAAVGVGSHAIHHLITEGRWPTLAECWQAFRVRLVPGLWAGPVVAVGFGLVVLDVAALRRGVVPGGAAAVTVVLIAAAVAAGYAALVAVQAGITGRGAARAAWSLALARPVTVLAGAGIVVFAALLAGFVHPVLVAVLAGYVLFALHVVTARLGGLPERARPAA